MNAIQFRRETPHWYTREGEPRYEATLREARKEGLLPGVTSIIKMLDNPGLRYYFRSQDILAAVTLPRIDGESEDDFVKRVVADSEAHAKQTAEWGSRIHDVIAAGECADDIRPWLEEFKRVDAEHTVSTFASEICLTNPKLGYGFRADRIALTRDKTVSMDDFKTRSVKAGKPKYYDTDVMQLAAEWFATQYRHDQLAPAPETARSIIINRDKPEVFVREWSDAELFRGWDMFLHCLGLWKLTNNYYPENHVAEAKQEVAVTA